MPNWRYSYGLMNECRSLGHMIGNRKKPCRAKKSQNAKARQKANPSILNQTSLYCLPSLELSRSRQANIHPLRLLRDAFDCAEQAEHNDRVFEGFVTSKLSIRRVQPSIPVSRCWQTTRSILALTVRTELGFPHSGFHKCTEDRLADSGNQDCHTSNDKPGKNQD